MYAVIEDSGSQIKVQQGDVIRVDLRELPDSQTQVPTLTFDRVLLIAGDGTPKIGQPYVDGASVTGDVLEQDSEKHEIIKFKRRKTYRRRNGHRQHFLKVRITNIKS